MPDVSADQLRQPDPLAPHTTLRLGGPARQLVTASNADEIAQSVRDAVAAGEPTLIVGGGSNLVVADEGFPGTAILIRSRGVTPTRVAGDEVTVRVAAGHPWDEVVAEAVEAGWSGLECLSGIPGSAGATPIQNVGAYGQEVAETITAVRVLDRLTGESAWWPAQRCRFGYRTSVFKRNQRWLVLAVEFRLRCDRLCAPVRYPELARALDCQVGDRVPAPVARQAVLGLRAGKGMVLDPTDPDTYSVGSFFMNPVLDPDAAARLRERTADLGELPAWPTAADPTGEASPEEAPASAAAGAASGEAPAGTALVKVSAAWLIQRAGFARGYGSQGVAISSKHTLALTHRGGGTTRGLLSLAAEIRDGVRTRFGVTLHPEPVLVNCTF